MSSVPFRLAANLSFLFTDRPFADRFAAAAGAGFQGVECLFPYGEMAAVDYARALADTGLEPALINMPPGDWDGGERGLAALPGREADFRDSVARAIDYAGEIGCVRLHCLAGVVDEDMDRGRVAQTYAANLAHAADLAAPHGIQVLIEPINPIDMPGYHLNSPRQALNLLAEIGHANLRLQYDFYHAELIAEDPIPDFIRAHADVIAHVQVAGVPERHEPDQGRPDIETGFGALAETEYAGWVGLEYRPRGKTEDGLGWCASWLR